LHRGEAKRHADGNRSTTGDNRTSLGDNRCMSENEHRPL